MEFEKVNQFDNLEMSYICDFSGGYISTCCLFCVHLYNFWYTIDDGIYLTCCNQNHDNCEGLKGNCEYFKSHW